MKKIVLIFLSVLFFSLPSKAAGIDQSINDFLVSLGQAVALPGRNI